jgi:predicted transcriptional regulator
MPTHQPPVPIHLIEYLEEHDDFSSCLMKCYNEAPVEMTDDNEKSSFALSLMNKVVEKVSARKQIEDRQKYTSQYQVRLLKHKAVP